jgi:hypothetical protein
VVWTGGERSILLWCAYTGAYLGALISKEVDPALEGEATSSASDREERKLFIDPCKVLLPRIPAPLLDTCVLCPRLLNGSLSTCIDFCLPLTGTLAQGSFQCLACRSQTRTNEQSWPAMPWYRACLMRLYMVQGLKVDSSGRAVARPHRLQREHWVEEQKGWAVAAEKRSAQYFESFAFRSGKALDGAGGLILRAQSSNSPPRRSRERTPAV